MLWALPWASPGVQRDLGRPAGGGVLRAAPPHPRGRHSKATSSAVTEAAPRAGTALRVGVCDYPESRKPSPLSKRERGESHWPCCPGSLSLTSFS